MTMVSMARAIFLEALAMAFIGGFVHEARADEAKWPEPTKEGLEFFENEVRPILANACYECHSAKSEKLKGDLFSGFLGRHLERRIERAIHHSRQS